MKPVYYRFPILIIRNEVYSRYKDILDQDIPKEEYSDGWVDIDINSIVYIYPQTSGFEEDDDVFDVTIIGLAGGTSYEVQLVHQQVRKILDYTIIDVKKLL